MSILKQLKLRLCEEVNFDSDGYFAMCGVINEFANALEPSHNTDSLQLLRCNLTAVCSKRDIRGLCGYNGGCYWKAEQQQVDA